MSPAGIRKAKSEAKLALNRLKAEREELSHELGWIEAVCHLSKAVEWIEDLQYAMKYDAEKLLEDAA